jgi:thiamine kinase-like enzyme
MADQPELDALFDRTASLAARPRKVRGLPGGLTNRNYQVSTPDGVFVARISDGGSELLAIDRDCEYRNSVTAAAAGNLARVAAACRRLHSGARFGNDFDMFDIQRRYLSVARSGGFRIPSGYDDLLPQVTAAEKALAARATRTVPCHNDLLAANFIDDGDRIWLIDYELSGNNDACFELGNIWAESHLPADALAELVTAYYGRPRRGKVARAQLLGLVGMYGWTLWGAIQNAVSPIDFDFWSWAMERFDGAAAGLTAAGFTRLLEQVQRDD